MKTTFFTLTVLVLIWSGASPKDSFTWVLEVTPALIGLPLLFWIDRKWRVSLPLYLIICLHGVILAVGGHYTYAEVPLGDWFKESFDLSRNHFDRLGHFFQGITPTFIFYEYFHRNKVITSRFWNHAIPVCIALSFSAFYELTEWWTAVATGEAATAFLGTQGDIWDTQWDMFMALCGALITITLISGLRTRALSLVVFFVGTFCFFQGVFGGVHFHLSM